MSRALIARSPDLRRLEDEGYSLRIVDDAYLLVGNVPYATKDGGVREGSLAMELTLQGDVTTKPHTHVAYWTGEFPYRADGSKLLALLVEDAARGTPSPSVPPAYMLSAKATGGYRNYHHKVDTYVDLLCREARAISPSSTAQQWKLVPNQEDAESPFEFADTASARQNTTDLARKLQHERVAIVGVGGTGSYVLDFVSKTWASEIHVFDDDPFLQHNAFRSPGPFSREDIEGGPIKSVFHGARYSRMRKGVIAQNACIDESNVEQVGAFDTVFVCMDGHPIKARILETCVSQGVLFIDVGMGLYRVNDSLAGIIRTTTCLPEHHEHAKECIDLSGDDAHGEYERNAQMAELNALNAALAVIKWKKIRGFYNDLTRELNSEYVIDGNKLINSYGPDESW